MNFKKVMKAPISPTSNDFGDGCYDNEDGTLSNSKVLYDLVDIPVTTSMKTSFIEAALAGGMSPEEVAIVFG